jgi:hypothetical protein
MNLRHTAALALVAWYLIKPPVESCFGALNGHRCAEVALTKWEIQDTFDSRDRCETHLAHVKEKGQSYTSQYLRNEPTAKRVDFYQADLMTWDAAQCIASDDPRLKGARLSN